MNANTATIIAAIIGLIGTVSTALITRPRAAPATQAAQTTQQPQTSQSSSWQPPPPAAGGNWWQQSASASQQRSWAAAPAPAPAPPPSYVGSALKISKSLWWGIAGMILWLIPILGYVATLTGLFIAIRDIRSPGTRRYAMAGLILCLVAFAFTLVNSAIGAYEGYHGTGWWQH